MNLEQLANLGEIVGALSVVATLIYLIFEVRQNTEAVRGATLLGNTEMWTNLLLAMSDSGNIGTYLYGSAGKADIKPKDFAQFMFYCRVYFISFEQQFLQYRNGYINEDAYRGYERSLCSEILVYRGFRMYWMLYRDNYSTDFVKRVDELLEQTAEIEPLDTIREWQKCAEKIESTGSHIA